jgi:putative Mg2+ transporter-C (MgtC) family protein
VLVTGDHLWLDSVFKVVLAYVLSFPTAWFLEKESHAIGIRTFPIVAMASCAFVLLGTTANGEMTADTSRIIQGLIAGIGFIGGGAILKEGTSVRGTATAASVWNTGGLGAAVAMGRYELAIALAALNLFTLRGLAPVKRRLDNPEGPQDEDPKKDEAPKK